MELFLSFNGLRLCLDGFLFFFDRFHWDAAADHVAVFAAAHVFNQNNKPALVTLVSFTFLFRQKITYQKELLNKRSLLKYKNFPVWLRYRVQLDCD